MKRLFDTELSYLQAFCRMEEAEDLIRFSDPELPDMYSHNLTYIKPLVGELRLSEVISREISLAQQAGRTFLNIQTDVPVDPAALTGLPRQPKATCLYDYYVFAPGDTSKLRSREGGQMLTLTADLRETALALDLRANGADMGDDFVTRRFSRRSQVYLSEDAVDHFLCFHNGRAVGHADLFVAGKVAKIEDVDIAPDSQRQGFGTAMLKALIELAWDRGAEIVYLITDHNDTAKDMYEKIGFTRVAQKAEWFFSFSS